jgi:SAM-dependent methyltransferase
MEWFRTWFDSPYYHILYGNRNEDEARFFIENLLRHFSFPRQAKILDACCGRGRHAIYLNSKGFDVTGIDLSESNIAHDRKCECDTLHFFIHDIRNTFRENYFDCVLNLFSSFGYFESEAENQEAISSLGKSLKRGGLLVIDFMNAESAKKNLVGEELEEINGIVFRIIRSYDRNFILKKIDIRDNGQSYSFMEKVMTLTKADYEKYFSNAGLKLKTVFGSYNLEPFIAGTSPRLILVAEKI